MKLQLIEPSSVSLSNVDSFSWSIEIEFMKVRFSVFFGHFRSETILMAKWAIRKDLNISTINWYSHQMICVCVCECDTQNQISITLPPAMLAEIMIIKFICGTSSNLDGGVRNPFPRCDANQMNVCEWAVVDLLVLSHYMIVNAKRRQWTLSIHNRKLNEPHLTGIYIVLLAVGGGDGGSVHCALVCAHSLSQLLL